MIELIERYRHVAVDPPCSDRTALTRAALAARRFELDNPVRLLGVRAGLAR